MTASGVEIRKRCRGTADLLLAVHSVDAADDYSAEAAEDLRDATVTHGAMAFPGGDATWLAAGG